MRSEPHVIGDYALFGEFASGGMATVHFGRLLGAEGVARSVAIKRLHSQFASEPEFVDMFTDEGRLAQRIRHDNVVPMLDVVTDDGQLYLVMEFVHGETLSRLLSLAKSRAIPVDPSIAVAVAIDLLHGLHAAHDATDERGAPLSIVHRDVSPHNVIVSTAGVARVLDFGVAKAAGRLNQTRDGQLKGKVTYMAPEQIRGGQVDRRTDVYAASIVLWEMLAGKRLFDGANEAVVLNQVMNAMPTAPSAVARTSPNVLDDIVLRGLSRPPSERFESARAMAMALEQTGVAASRDEIATWVADLAGERIRSRADVLSTIERETRASAPSPRNAEPDVTRVSKAVALAPFGKVPAAATSEPFPTTTSGREVGVDSHDPARRLWLPVLVAGVLVAAAALVILSWPKTDKNAPEAVAAPTEPARVMPVDTAIAPTAQPRATAEPKPPSTSAPDELPPPVAPTASVAPAPPRPRQVASPRAPLSATAPAKAAADCAPYTVDEKGHRRYNKECL